MNLAIERGSNVMRLELLGVMLRASGHFLSECQWIVLKNMCRFSMSLPCRAAGGVHPSPGRAGPVGPARLTILPIILGSLTRGMNAFDKA
jgi:hypothetical protein